MAEDQGVNGDAWTDEACRLFGAAGWRKIGDSNIDIKDSRGKSFGIDSIFSYQDGYKPNVSRGVFLEAKRWSTTSAREISIHGWINDLSDKIAALRNSPGLLDTYQETRPLELSTGLIAAYFSDVGAYDEFEPKLVEWLTKLKVPSGRNRRAFYPRIVLMSNSRLLWLVSVLSAIKDWKSSAANGETRELKFFYPSAGLHGNPAIELSCLNVEYLLSSVILAKGVSRVEAVNQTTVHDFIFYDGPMDSQSFRRVASILQGANMIDARNELHVFKYRRETDEFRKIKPSVKSMFEELGAKSVSIEEMDNTTVFPAWILNGE